MIKQTYFTIVVLMVAFTACVLSFVATSDIFHYLLAVFNLVMLFNTLRIAVEMEL